MRINLPGVVDFFPIFIIITFNHTQCVCSCSCSVVAELKPKPKLVIKQNHVFTSVEIVVRFLLPELLPFNFFFRITQGFVLYIFPFHFGELFSFGFPIEDKWKMKGIDWNILQLEVLQFPLLYQRIQAESFSMQLSRQPAPATDSIISGCIRTLFVIDIFLLHLAPLDLTASSNRYHQLWWIIHNLFSHKPFIYLTLFPAASARMTLLFLWH